jgi:hypothetical protein
MDLAFHRDARLPSNGADVDGLWAYARRSVDMHCLALRLDAKPSNGEQHREAAITLGLDLLDEMPAVEEENGALEWTSGGRCTTYLKQTARDGSPDGEGRRSRERQAGPSQRTRGESDKKESSSRPFRRHYFEYQLTEKPSVELLTALGFASSGPVLLII